MICIHNNRNVEYRSEKNDGSSNIISFPLVSNRSAEKPQVFEDPGIDIIADDGRRLDKLGMSADECCYILPPCVSVISLERHDPVDSSGSVGATSSVAMPVRVIISESDAVTEIGMDNERGSDALDGRGQPTHWLVPGRTLFLARQSPHDVAMLSIKLKMGAGPSPQK